MPENDEQDVPGTGTQAPLESAREKFEREQLTRRQALRKFGITSAMATFAMFSVDDLARMVGKAMEQRVADNKIARQVAHEFQEAGIALASGASNTSPSTGSNSPGCLSGFGACGSACIDYCSCLNKASIRQKGCKLQTASHINVSGFIDCNTQYDTDKQTCRDAYAKASNTAKGPSGTQPPCCSCNCKGGSPCPDPTKSC